MLFDLVVNFLFLSLWWGPIIVISTNGRNMPDVCHFRSLAATTGKESHNLVYSKYSFVLVALDILQLCLAFNFLCLTQNMSVTWQDLFCNARICYFDLV